MSAALLKQLLKPLAKSGRPSKLGGPGADMAKFFEALDVHAWDAA
jgi:hypothetical protein